MMRVRTNGPEPKRFWTKVAILENGCWQWKAGKCNGGHGLFHLQGGKKNIKAHVWAYVKHIGRVPDGKELDHLCRNPACVNPLHLEPVTHRENILRGNSFAAMQARRTHCIHGHPLSGDNLGYKDGHRWCKLCRHLRYKRWKETKHAASL